MEKICYELPKKAIEILNELAEAELQTVSFYIYLGFCCANDGYLHAADHFNGKSKNERYHFERITQFLQSRGIEPEVPKIEAYKGNFEDLRSMIAAAYKKEIEITEKYDECIKMMRSIDTMAHIKLVGFMEGQQWNLDEFQKMWSVFGDLDEVEAQKEQDVLYFAPKTETPTAM